MPLTVGANWEQAPSPLRSDLDPDENTDAAGYAPRGRQDVDEKAERAQVVADVVMSAAPGANDDHRTGAGDRRRRGGPDSVSARVIGDRMQQLLERPDTEWDELGRGPGAG
ncbi:hypothetical protein GCM10010435_07840 [Winogradskya consettensis]|uniref:Uncharacterized protein n=1 Tax=Winogradskya consettensis TaxID=113560 RepID=A0A919SJ79_9ACTN|nr:hypothetical protein Aco04nite_31630 [Actinoplanes consettensis]